jgi:concanavalin A-like lectin/glucanase superfamily protein
MKAIYAIIIFLFSLSVCEAQNGQIIWVESKFETQQQPTLLDSAIALYEFEETAGTTFVDSTGKHNGTIAGSGVTINQTGNPGQAHDFQSGYNTIPDHDDFTFDNDFAVSCYVKFDAVGSTNGIVGKNLEWEFFLYNTYKFAMRFFANGTASYFQVYTNATFTAGVEYHVVFNVSAFDTEYTGYDIWVDGVNEATSNNNSPVTLSNTSAEVRVGRGGYYVNQYTDGKISRLRFYDRALKEAEIQAGY